MPGFCKDKTVIFMLMNKLLLSLNPSKSYKGMYSVTRQIKCIKPCSGNPSLQLNIISSWEQFFNKRAAAVPRTCQQLQLQLENSRLYFSGLICCLKHNPENFSSKKVTKMWSWVCQWSQADSRELEAVFWQCIHKICSSSTHCLAFAFYISTKKNTENQIGRFVSLFKFPENLNDRKAKNLKLNIWQIKIKCQSSILRCRIRKSEKITLLQFDFKRSLDQCYWFN